VASYGVDTNRYSNTGATNHITGELNNLTVSDKYQEHDRVNTASGQGLKISHIGHSLFALLLRIFIFATYYMFSIPLKICSLSISSHMIMVYS
jgi:hypothetical protein